MRTDFLFHTRDHDPPHAREAILAWIREPGPIRCEETAGEIEYQCSEETKMADLAKLEAAIRNSPAAKEGRLVRRNFGHHDDRCCGLTAACGEYPATITVDDGFGLGIMEQAAFMRGWDDDELPYGYPKEVFSLGRRLARELIDLSPDEAGRP